MTFECRKKPIMLILILSILMVGGDLFANNLFSMIDTLTSPDVTVFAKINLLENYQNTLKKGEIYAEDDLLDVLMIEFLTVPDRDLQTRPYIAELAQTIFKGRPEKATEVFLDIILNVDSLDSYKRLHAMKALSSLDYGLLPTDSFSLEELDRFANGVETLFGDQSNTLRNLNESEVPVINLVVLKVLGNFARTQSVNFSLQRISDANPQISEEAVNTLNKIRLVSDVEQGYLGADLEVKSVRQRTVIPLRSLRIIQKYLSTVRQRATPENLAKRTYEVYTLLGDEHIDFEKVVPTIAKFYAHQVIETKVGFSQFVTSLFEALSLLESTGHEVALSDPLISQVRPWMANYYLEQGDFYMKRSRGALMGKNIFHKDRDSITSAMINYKRALQFSPKETEQYAEISLAMIGSMLKAADIDQDIRLSQSLVLMRSADQVARFALENGNKHGVKSRLMTKLQDKHQLVSTRLDGYKLELAGKQNDSGETLALVEMEKIESIFNEALDEKYTDPEVSREKLELASELLEHLKGSEHNSIKVAALITEQSQSHAELYEELYGADFIAVDSSPLAN